MNLSILAFFLHIKIGKRNKKILTIKIDNDILLGNLYIIKINRGGYYVRY